MDNDKRMIGLGGLIAISQSRKGVAFLVTIIIMALGKYVLEMDTQTTMGIATLAASYILGQSFVDGRTFVVEIESEIEELLPEISDGQNTSA